MGGEEENESWSGGFNVYSHNFRASVSVHALTAAINVKRASMLDLISQATYILSEKNRHPLILQGETEFIMLSGIGHGPQCRAQGP